jgi:hypothetical protein
MSLYVYKWKGSTIFAHQSLKNQSMMLISISSKRPKNGAVIKRVFRMVHFLMYVG